MQSKENVVVYLHVFLTLAPDGLSGHLHVPAALTAGFKPPVGPRAGMDGVARGKNHALRKSNPVHLASSLVTILTE
jgi:hypothetical protein